jgi:lambda repressor-like predicted transcriptional regulator
MENTIKQVIKAAIANRGYNQAAVAKKAGWSNQSSLSTAINRDNPSMETVLRIMDALEYDVIIRDRNSANEWKVDKV